jgi:hypothetical protein
MRRMIARIAMVMFGSLLTAIAIAWAVGPVRLLASSRSRSCGRLSPPLCLQHGSRSVFTVDSGRGRSVGGARVAKLAS